MRYTKILGAMALCAMACSSRGNTTVIPDTDTGVVTDTGSTPIDTGSTPTDTGSTPTDRPVTPTDRPVTPTDRPTTTDTGPAQNFGTCGMTTVQCLCAAGADGAEQNRCVSTNMDCAVCINGAAGMCCPTQGTALQSCISSHMCMDQACVTANCTTQFNALNTCFMAGQMSDPMCQAAMATCFGAFPPECS